MTSTLRIGTRRSRLALAQAELVKRALEEHHACRCELVEIVTLGDKKQGTPAASVGDKKDWILELERAVLDRSVDLAVHSGKDVPIDIESGTALLPIFNRATPFDGFLGQIIEATGQRVSFNVLPEGALVGTASLRRKAQLLRLRPDLRVIEFRGNVPTRIEKFARDSTLSGILLACAGLERLGLAGIGCTPLPPEEIVPAVHQGTLVVQFREDRRDLGEILGQLVEESTRVVWEAERTCVGVLGADCKSAVAVYGVATQESVQLHARVLTPDGRKCLELKGSAPVCDARTLGESVGRELIKQGADKLLEESRTFTAR